MIVVKWIAVFLLCFVLQTALVPAIGVFGVYPDLLIVALFFLALKTGPLTALWVGFFLGLAQDLYSPMLGQNALSKAATGFFAGLFNERMMRIDFVLQLVLLLVSFLVNDALFYLVQIVKDGGGAGAALHDLTVTTVPRALYSILFALVPHLKHFFPAVAFRR